MNLYEITFFVAFTGCILILGYKLYTLMKVKALENKELNIIWPVLGFIAFFIFYFMAFSVTMLHPEILIYITLFNLLRALVLVNVIFFIIELLISLGAFASAQVEAYKPNRR